MNWLISLNGIRRAAARGCELAANPLNADFVPMFLIVHELQPDRRTSLWAAELRHRILAGNHVGPLAADHLQQTRRLWRQLGWVVQI